MAKFCRYCGSPVREESRFCGACGKPIVEVESQAGTQPRIKPESSAAARKSTAAQKPGSAKKSVSSQKKNTAQKAQTTKAKAVMKPQIREVTAAAAAGEIDCGNFSFAGFDTLAAQIVPELLPAHILENEGDMSVYEMVLEIPDSHVVLHPDYGVPVRIDEVEPKTHEII